MVMSNVLGSLLGLHAQTLLHPGAGTALGTVDLPIQRERHTHWPTIAGSALKGILRDACRERIAELPAEQLEGELRHDDEFDEAGGVTKRAARSGTRRGKADATLKLNRLFGPPTAGAGEFAGALSVCDARLLAYPVRSLKGVFAWVSCPAVLTRLQRDARLAGCDDFPDSIPPVAPHQFVAPNDCPCIAAGKNAEGENCEQVVLEEFDFTRRTGEEGKLSAIAAWISQHLLPEHPETRQRFQAHLLLLSDDDFTHFARHATEIVARIGLNYETKTVNSGALFYQEFLPAETVLYSVVLANRSRAAHGKIAGQETDGRAELLKLLQETICLVPYSQIGGDETTGKGICAVCLTAPQPCRPIGR
jgi:CRISPR-associated protein Cmr4